MDRIGICCCKQVYRRRKEATCNKRTKNVHPAYRCRIAGSCEGPAAPPPAQPIYEIIETEEHERLKAARGITTGIIISDTVLVSRWLRRLYAVLAGLRRSRGVVASGKTYPRASKPPAKIGSLAEDFVTKS